MSDLNRLIRDDLDYRRGKLVDCDDPFTEFAFDGMRAAIEAVLDLHQPCDAEHTEPDCGVIWGKVCVECGSDSIGSWPCPTVRAIAEKLGVEVPR